MGDRMHYFTIEQREALERLLKSRIDILRDEIAEDRKTDLNAEPEAAALKRDVEELRAVEEALAKLHQPDFGLCAECGGEIPFSRLTANLSATRCMACASRR